MSAPKMKQIDLFDLGATRPPVRQPPTAHRIPIHLWYPRKLSTIDPLVHMFGDEPPPVREIYVCVFRSDTRRMPLGPKEGGAPYRGTHDPNRATCRLCLNHLAEFPQLRNALAAIAREEREGEE